MMKNLSSAIKFHVLSTLLIIAVLLAFIINSVKLQELASEKSQTDVKIHSMGFSNDPFSDTQWYINNPGQYINLSEVMKRQRVATEDVDMDIIEAWEQMKKEQVTEREIVVAIIDTGVDYTHPDLAENMWVNPGEIAGDNIDNDNNGYVDDIYGWDFYNDDDTVCHYTYSERYGRNMANLNDNDNHGTHVAGIIAAVANNEMGIAGVASNINIKIMSLKINGGKDGTGDASDAIKAIKYAEMMGADICNLSWGTTRYDAELEETMRESEMLFVAAAGNDGIDIDEEPLYPACFELDNLITVTFIDADGDLTGYSNYGKKSIDMAAPGDDIFSTVVGSYNSMSGSSMAAPQVSAVAAMLYAYNDHLYASNIKEILEDSIKEIEGLDQFMVYGGMPSAYKAVMATGNLIQDDQAPVLSFETIYKKGEMTVPVYVEDDGTSGIRVVKWIYGKKSIQDFKNGTNGTTVVNNQVDLSKAGVYTFYASDYAGNETAQTYEVLEDTEAPKLTVMFTVADNYKSRTVTVITSDKQSGLKRVEYMAGIKKTEDFLPADAGTVLKMKDGKGKFKIKKDGIYTIFATDNRGNNTTKQVVIKTIKAKKLKLNTTDKTLSLGDLFILRSYIMPDGSTDKITFTSSDETIATVSQAGKVFARKQGIAFITAKTSSGLSETCVITVDG